MKRVGDAYMVDKRQIRFFVDLVKLNVPDLLHVPEDDDHDVELRFNKLIQNFVKENNLRESLLEQLLIVVVRHNVYALIYLQYAFKYNS